MLHVRPLLGMMPRTQSRTHTCSKLVWNHQPFITWFAIDALWWWSVFKIGRSGTLSMGFATHALVKWKDEIVRAPFGLCFSVWTRPCWTTVCIMCFIAKTLHWMPECGPQSRKQQKESIAAHPVDEPPTKRSFLAPRSCWAWCSFFSSNLRTYRCSFRSVSHPTAVQCTDRIK